MGNRDLICTAIIAYVVNAHLVHAKLPHLFVVNGAAKMYGCMERLVRRKCERVCVCARRVGPLYQHVFPPAAAPTLSFVGLPWKVVPFCQYELQSKWIARCLSGRALLPDPAAMRADIAAFYARLEADGVPQRWALSNLH